MMVLLQGYPDHPEATRPPQVAYANVMDCEPFRRARGVLPIEHTIYQAKGMVGIRPPFAFRGSSRCDGRIVNVRLMNRGEIGGNQGSALRIQIWRAAWEA
jgi:hypothetical protein